MTPGAKTLDAVKEFRAWFDEARLRLSNSIRVEVRLPGNESKYSNHAMLGLFSGDGVSGDIRCHLAITGGDCVDLTTAILSGAIDAHGTAIAGGNVEYIVQDMRLQKNLRCKDTPIKDVPHLRAVLDEHLCDFIDLVSR